MMDAEYSAEELRQLREALMTGEYSSEQRASQLLGMIAVLTVERDALRSAIEISKPWMEIALAGEQERDTLRNGLMEIARRANVGPPQIASESVKSGGWYNLVIELGRLATYTLERGVADHA